jgi:hypothetical protein
MEKYAENREKKKWIYDSIMLLEDALEKSKFNYHFKILLIRLYLELGVYTRPAQLFESLEIKQIQHDTLSYLFCDTIDIFGVYDVSKFLLDASLTIYKSNEKEVWFC